MKIAVIIPAYNEEQSIAKVIEDIPKEITEIVVVNNCSSDGTVKAAENAGATVLHESVMGYGAACLNGIDYLQGKDFEIVVFLDGDYSDYPNELNLLVEPIEKENYDFVLGSRVLGNREKGALPLQSRIGSLIAGFLIKIFWKVKYTDLGPFRAIKFDKLLQLNMKDKWFGWTVEMQIKAAKNKYNILEVPVSYRKRIGKSKVTGTIKGSVMASLIILKTIFVQIFRD
ncbi:MAG: glycosyltransferase family 2 protein [Ignavibacteria bacterium]|nr:glycosyltransferase family 2 protein [Ignavibacteria bacterium]MBT8381901.1 glycosyltransferase family 2 protein [Ignavibacteria bacterium]MBT8391079.1 glycosyltransferase family 2 protein [Ignavibacteria bacterium]NNJ54446.1 glycosyltransferase family 2 protein [Ignavibacteriaceae bacterium]NNL21865.1 glycosyltransferase family 2 protein [Ignavibacteriaceae bacterium]